MAFGYFISRAKAIKYIHMGNEKLKELAQKIFDTAGIQIDGRRPFDIRVKNDGFYRRVLHEGSIGLGESYMDGWWEADDLTGFFYRLLSSDIERSVRGNWKAVAGLFFQTLFNPQTKKKSRIVGERHYDIGNDLYKTMLDSRLVYTCGYWKDARNLEEAQEAKLDLVCKKIGLKPGQRILDIGCGWGSFMKYAVQKYNVSAVGVTVSKEQAKLGRELCAGLPVEIILTDYRNITGQFDHIVSLGMFEHVGHKNYRTFFETASKHLKDDGIFLLHTIGRSFTSKTTDPWTEKYIFPNSILPSLTQITGAIEGLFIMEDWHNFGLDYDKTAGAWLENFNRGWDKLKDKYGERFYRMWTYWLGSSRAAFRVRKMQLWQIVLSKKGVPGGYRSIR